MTPGQGAGENEGAGLSQTPVFPSKATATVVALDTRSPPTRQCVRVTSGDRGPRRGKQCWHCSGAAVATSPTSPESDMADDDFDVAALAAYLHMMPAQISKLVERGKLPGRRVGGAWRFSRPEISQWLEQRIGLSDDDQLAEMETTLERTDATGAGEVNLDELLTLEAVAVPLAARTRGSVIAAMCQLAADTGLLWDAGKMAEAVTAREAMAPTALDIGVALLHPRRPQASLLAQSTLALGITSQGIPFGGARGGLTDVFFLIAATSDHEHLRVLARLSRIVNDAEWLSELRAAPDAVAARRLVVERAAAMGR
jgi:nitrogen PTS system EIIA component